VSRLDALVAPLTDAVMAVGNPLPPDQAEYHQKAIQDALCAALRAVPRPGVAPDRLEPETLREDATRIIKRADSPEALIATMADLLCDVREADQREEWIRQGYSSDAHTAYELMEQAQREASQYRHALRLVKRATRDVKVGRE